VRVLTYVAKLATLLLTVSLVATVLASSARAGEPPADKSCVGAEEASARSAGDDEAPPKFSRAMFRRRFTLEVSLDGADGRELPISIEEVCGLPKRRAKEAAALAGNDGIALILARTQVWQDGTRLSGTEATTAVDGADTALLRVRLVRQRAWRDDEDGEPIPTFRTGRIDITD
jgi:hypothetical protein